LSERGAATIVQRSNRRLDEIASHYLAERRARNGIFRRGDRRPNTV